MTIQDFWQQVYSASGLNEGQASPRQISVLLDQAVRELMVLIDPERLHPLGAIFDFQSLHDLSQDVSGFTVETQRISLFKIKGENGMFWPDGIYDDQGGFSWPANQAVKPEIFKIATVNFSPRYYVGGNVVSGGGELHQAREIPWRQMQQFDDTAIGDPMTSERFYDKAQITPDGLQGQYVDKVGATFNVERTVQLKFSLFGNMLATHPAVDQNASVLLSVWALFFPERFIYGDGSLKQEWQNSTAQCQMPSEFWPAMVEWTAGRARALTTAQDKALAMQDVLASLNMGDAINERREQERYPSGHR